MTCGACLVPGTPIPLADVTAFRAIEDGVDPFAGEGGPAVVCPASAAGPGDFAGEPVFDVSTDACPRITVATSTLVDVEKGDLIAIRAWHDPLYAGGEEGAEAVLALAIGGDEVWRTAIPIPQPTGAAVLAEVPAARGWPEGAPIAWHVHNHGKNSYHLLEVAVRPLVPAAQADAE